MLDGEETRRIIGRITRAQKSEEVWAHTDCLVIGVDQLAADIADLLTDNTALREEVAELKGVEAAVREALKEHSIGLTVSRPWIEAALVRRRVSDE